MGTEASLSSGCVNYTPCSFPGTVRMESLNLINYLGVQTYSFSNRTAQNRNEGSCLSLHNNERERSKGGNLGSRPKDREACRGPKLTLNQESYLLSFQRKLWVPQPDLSGSEMLTLIANLLPIYAGCPVRT